MGFLRKAYSKGSIKKASIKIEDLGTDIMKTFPRLTVRIASIDPIRMSPNNYFYFRNRSVSSYEYHGPNDNGDAFEQDELEKRYATFIGVEETVDHNAFDRIGMVLDSIWVPFRGVLRASVITGGVQKRNVFVAASDLKPDAKYGLFLPEDIKVGSWVENIHAMDKRVAEAKHPGLVEEIQNGEVTDTSMGCFVQESLCSYPGCGNIARNEVEYCAHIPSLKGKKVELGAMEGVNQVVAVCEINRGVTFFEDSVILPIALGGTAGGRGADRDAHMLEVFASVESPLDKYVVNRRAQGKGEFRDVVAEAPPMLSMEQNAKTELSETPEAVERGEKEMRKEKLKRGLPRLPEDDKEDVNDEIEDLEEETTEDIGKIEKDVNKALKGGIGVAEATKLEDAVRTAKEKVSSAFAELRASVKEVEAQKKDEYGDKETLGDEELPDKEEPKHDKEGVAQMKSGTEEVLESEETKSALGHEKKSEKKGGVTVKKTAESVSYDKADPSHDSASEAAREKGSLDTTQGKDQDQAKNLRTGLDESPKGGKAAEVMDTKGAGNLEKTISYKMVWNSLTPREKYIYKNVLAEASQAASEYMAKAMLPKDQGGDGVTFDEALSESHDLFGEEVVENVRELSESERLSEEGAPGQEKPTIEQVVALIDKLLAAAKEEGNEDEQKVLEKAKKALDKYTEKKGKGEEEEEPKVEKGEEESGGDELDGDEGKMASRKERIARLLRRSRMFRKNRIARRRRIARMKLADRQSWRGSGETGQIRDDQFAQEEKPTGGKKSTDKEAFSFDRDAPEAGKLEFDQKDQKAMKEPEKDISDAEKLQTLKNLAQRSSKKVEEEKVVAKKETRVASEKSDVITREAADKRTAAVVEATTQHVVEARKIAKMMSDKGLIDPQEEDEVFETLCSLDRREFTGVAYTVGIANANRSSRRMSLREASVEKIEDRVRRLAEADESETPIPVGTGEAGEGALSELDRPDFFESQF